MWHRPDPTGFKQTRGPAAAACRRCLVLEVAEQRYCAWEARQGGCGNQKAGLYYCATATTGRSCQFGGLILELDPGPSLSHQAPLRLPARAGFFGRGAATGKRRKRQPGLESRDETGAGGAGRASDGAACTDKAKLPGPGPCDGAWSSTRAWCCSPLIRL